MGEKGGWFPCVLPCSVDVVESRRNSWETALPRAVILVLDSVGCGPAPDSLAYGDRDPDTLGHIAHACACGLADRAGLRQGPLRLPHLSALGLGAAAALSTGHWPPGLDLPVPGASFGIAIERSAGKDTPSGHWEIAGTPVPSAWGYFPQEVPCLPRSLTDALIAQAGLPGLLGNRHDSGTTIIASLGDEHMRSGKPIAYTSVDSVLQIAAHEEAFGLDRLYDVCRIARRLCDPLAIGRIIARPFVGHGPTAFRRTANRRDFAMPPPAGTILQRAGQAGRAVVSVGKIADIFAHAFTGDERKGGSNDGNVDLLLEALAEVPQGGLIVTNLVDFDSDYGHRRDVAGYAACLEAFDARLPAIRAALRPDDLLIVTADHGNDPTAAGTDHTREVVPVLAICAARGPMTIGRRPTFADIGATAAAHLALPPTPAGTAWLSITPTF